MTNRTSAGQIDGQEVHRVILTGAQGLRAEVLTYGARLAAL